LEDNLLENNLNNPLIESAYQKEDTLFELPLRPKTLNDFVGQSAIQDRLKVMIKAANQRNDALSHLLFSGPPGLGKTTLSHILAKEMHSNLVITSGPALEKPSDLAGLLTNLQKNDILFIDEIHRLNKTIEEYLYSAMESYTLDIIIDQGPSARSVQIKLNPFTLIGATTRSGTLSSPMRSRFGSIFRLDHYPVKDLEMIISRSAKLLHLDLDQKSAKEIAKRARGTPRIANNLLKWVRDYVQAHTKKGLVSESLCIKALEMIGIDAVGLDEMDHKILTVMIDHYKGGPVGIKTLSIAVGEEPTTIEEVHEPYLIMQGFIKRTPKGRLATKLAKAHIKEQVSNKEG